jgi:hypothetical protein
MEAMGLAVSALLYLPFAIADFRRRRAGAPAAPAAGT